jgi:hypothetical protein
MRGVIQGASKQYIGEKIHISTWRQIAIAIPVGIARRIYSPEMSLMPREEKVMTGRMIAMMTAMMTAMITAHRICRPATVPTLPE